MVWPFCKKSIMSQNTEAITLPIDAYCLNFCGSREPVCFHWLFWFFNLRSKCWIHISSWTTTPPKDFSGSARKRAKSVYQISSQFNFLFRVGIRDSHLADCRLISDMSVKIAWTEQNWCSFFCNVFDTHMSIIRYHPVNGPHLTVCSCWFWSSRLWLIYGVPLDLIEIGNQWLLAHTHTHILIHSLIMQFVISMNKECSISMTEPIYLWIA